MRQQGSTTPAQQHLAPSDPCAPYPGHCCGVVILRNSDQCLSRQRKGVQWGLVYFCHWQGAYTKRFPHALTEVIRARVSDSISTSSEPCSEDENIIYYINVYRWFVYHWLRTVVMPTLSSLEALQVAITLTCAAAECVKVSIMTIVDCLWEKKTRKQPLLLIFENLDMRVVAYKYTHNSVMI